jgi:hypothetical protein
VDWLKNEIRTGFQSLMCLSLPRTPAAEVIRGTVEVWAASLCKRLTFEQVRDTPRIREAFAELVLSSTEWPSPAQFLAEFGRTQPDQPRIEKDRRIPASRDARLAKLAEMLGEDFNPRAARRDQ